MGDSDRLELKVYLLGTRKSLTVVVSKVHQVREVIKHILKTCTTSPAFQREFFTPKPGADPARSALLLNPDAHELRLPEEDEDEYFLPQYEIAPLNKHKSIGEFEVDAVVLCRISNYKPIVTSATNRLPSPEKREKKLSVDEPANSVPHGLWTYAEGAFESALRARQKGDDHDGDDEADRDSGPGAQEDRPPTGRRRTDP